MFSFLAPKYITCFPLSNLVLCMFIILSSVSFNHIILCKLSSLYVVFTNLIESWFFVRHSLPIVSSAASWITFFKVFHLSSFSSIKRSAFNFSSVCIVKFSLMVGSPSYWTLNRLLVFIFFISRVFLSVTFIFLITNIWFLSQSASCAVLTS